MPSASARAKAAPEPLPEIEAAASAALERYLAHLAGVRRRSELTIRNYRTDIEEFLRFLAPKGVAYDAAGRGDGRSYLSHLQDLTRAEGSIRRCSTTIRGFYGWLDANDVTLRARPGDSMLRLRYPKKSAACRSSSTSRRRSGWSTRRTWRRSAACATARSLSCSGARGCASARRRTWTCATST